MAGRALVVQVRQVFPVRDQQAGRVCRRCRDRPRRDRGRRGALATARRLAAKTSTNSTESVAQEKLGRHRVRHRRAIVVDVPVGLSQVEPAIVIGVKE